MTEEEWLRSESVDHLFSGIPATPRPRKVVLFACACCRRLESQLSPTLRGCISTIEAWADGAASTAKRALAHRSALAENATSDSSAVLAVTELCDPVGDPLVVSQEANCAVVETGGESAGKAEHRVQLQLLRCIVGNPFRPVVADPRWLTGDAVALARAAYDGRAWETLPVLADALQEAGCDDVEMLGHLRGPGPHARGCWVVDLVLGKA